MAKYLHSGLALIACLATATFATQALGQGVTVQVPVEKPKGPPIAFYCRIQIPTEGGRYYAGRTLDAQGQMISDSISWQDGHSGDKNVGPRIDIRWWSENAPHRFERGVVNFVVYGPKPVGYYAQLRFNRPDSDPAYSREAGPISGSPDDNRASAFFPVGEFLTFAKDTSKVNWVLEYRKKYQGPIKGKITEGDFSTSALISAKAVFEQIIPALEAKQANYQTSCTTR